jgi:hypothetical protein
VLSDQSDFEDSVALARWEVGQQPSCEFGRQEIIDDDVLKWFRCGAVSPEQFTQRVRLDSMNAEPIPDSRPEMRLESARHESF